MSRAGRKHPEHWPDWGKFYGVIEVGDEIELAYTPRAMPGLFGSFAGSSLAKKSARFVVESMSHAADTWTLVATKIVLLGGSFAKAFPLVLDKDWVTSWRVVLTKGERLRKLQLKVGHGKLCADCFEPFFNAAGVKILPWDSKRMALKLAPKVDPRSHENRRYYQQNLQDDFLMARWRYKAPHKGGYRCFSCQYDKIAATGDTVSLRVLRGETIVPGYLLEDAA